MSVTINKIAELCNVSRGTVDRALNHKSGIRTEVAEKIRKVALEQGYVPKHTGNASFTPDSPIRIGIVVHSSTSDFVKALISKIGRKSLEMENLSSQIILRSIEGVDVQHQLALINELVEEEHVSGLALMPLASDLLRDKINQLDAHDHIPVVTFNTDLPESKRIAYVGPDDLAAGRTAAALMKLSTRETGKILLIADRTNGHFAHCQRLTGFLSEFSQLQSHMEILETQYCYQDQPLAERIVLRHLEVHPNLTGIYSPSPDCTGIYRALQKANAVGQVHVIVHDLSPNNLRMLQEGVVDFAIGQDTKTQGVLPIILLHNYLTKKRLPKNDTYAVDIEIKCRYNIGHIGEEI